MAANNNAFLAGIDVHPWTPTRAAPARASISFAGALASANAIVTSTATSASPVTLLPASGFASTTSGNFTAPRTVSVTTAAHAGSYAIGAGNAITVTGTDHMGTVITDTLVLTAVNGGETITSSKAFFTVTEIDIPAQNDNLGHWTFGVNDVFLPYSVSKVFVGTSSSANLHVGYGVSSSAALVKDTIPKVPAGAQLSISPQWIYGDSTVSDISVWF